jgi:hypothetical protein
LKNNDDAIGRTDYRMAAKNDVTSAGRRQPAEQTKQ